MKEKEAMPSTYKEGIPRCSAIVEHQFPFGGEDEKRFHSWLAAKGVRLDDYMKAANEG